MYSESGHENPSHDFVPVADVQRGGRGLGQGVHEVIVRTVIRVQNLGSVGIHGLHPQRHFLYFASAGHWTDLHLRYINEIYMKL